MPSMNRRDALGAIAKTGIALFGAPAVLRGRFQLFGQQGATYSARAVRLVEETVVIDMLNQFRFPDFAEKPPRSQKWMNRVGSFAEQDWEVYRSSGIDVFALGHGAGSYEEAVKYFADWNGFLAQYDQWFMRIDDMRDIERLAGSGRVGVLLTFQGSDHFRNAPDVDTFYALGQRVSQLTYNYQNRLGSGFLETKDGGLSVFWRRDRGPHERRGYGGGPVTLRRPDDSRRYRGLEEAGDLLTRQREGTCPRSRALQDRRNDPWHGADRRGHGDPVPPNDDPRR